MTWDSLVRLSIFRGRGATGSAHLSQPCAEQGESGSENSCPMAQVMQAEVWASIQRVDLRGADSGDRGKLQRSVC